MTGNRLVTRLVAIMLEVHLKGIMTILLAYESSDCRKLVLLSYGRKPHRDRFTQYNTCRYLSNKPLGAEQIFYESQADLTSFDLVGNLS